MRYEYTKSGQIGGISEAHRRLLARLHWVGSEPFTVLEAAEAMGVDRTRAARLLAHWASRGWLSRVRRGLYITVPLGARDPSSRREDPWIVAMKLFHAAYIGGWSACEHWGLTEQIFADVVVFTTRRIRTRRQKVQDTKFILRTVPEDRLWGTTPVWRRNSKVLISDPSRTLADILNESGIGGGMRHVAEILENYFAGEHRADMLLVDYISRLRNRTVCKRLGFLLEALGIEAQEILEYCRAHISAGYSKLDPGIATRGRLLRRWNLELNININPE